MDISSQLISMNSEPDVHAALKERLRDDIRVSVHAQHPVEFLGEVRGHRFDLVVFGEPEQLAARLAATSPAPGGLPAAFHQAPAADADGDELEQALTDGGLLIEPAVSRWLIAARAADNLKAKRRGGRRKRPPFRG